MIVKLDKNGTTTEGARGLFYFGEDEFIFWPSRREKVKFMGIKDNKDLYFLGMLRLRIWVDRDALYWHKKQ